MLQMKYYRTTENGRRIRSNEDANAIIDLTEEFALGNLRVDTLPPMNKMAPDPDLESMKDKSRGMEKALEILDEYEKDVPKRDPDVPQYEE